MSGAAERGAIIFALRGAIRGRLATIAVPRQAQLQAMGHKHEIQQRNGNSAIGRWTREGTGGSWTKALAQPEG